MKTLFENWKKYMFSEEEEKTGSVKAAAFTKIEAEVNMIIDRAKGATGVDLTLQREYLESVINQLAQYVNTNLPGGQ